MDRLRHLLSACIVWSTLAGMSAFAQTSLTAVRDTVSNSDGSGFNGTVIITWNGLAGTSGTSVTPHSTSAHIYNGVLSVLLVPSTTASGAFYNAAYNSNDGTVAWSETWNVPPSTTPVTLSQIRGSQTTGGGGTTSGGGTGGTIAVPIPISDVLNLSSILGGINNSILTLTNTVAGLSQGGGGATGLSPVFVDGETPGGTANGLNAGFTLAGTPSPATSLEVYRNGLVQTIGVDYTISGNAITFLPVALPQSGDLLQAYYRVAGSGQAASFTDAEVPAGTLDGANATFTLSIAPSPAASLKLYKNGVLLRWNSDFTVNGATLTFANSTIIPQPGDVLVAFYRH